MTGYPRAFGPYELLSEIARGASSRVFRARPQDGGPEVALKMLREDESGAGATVRFRREAQMAARLRHPNIVPVLDAGESEGRFYYTMPLIEGRPLAAGAGSPPPAPLLEKVARAVHHAHERGVIHRDLKPTNILVRDDGEPMVTDFGIARDQRRATQLTTAGELLGTPAYMAPEQIAGMAHKADARTDVYALGAVLYFVLTGRPPFDATSFVELSAQVLHVEPPAPRSLAAGADPRLEAICLRCLRKNPADRYPSALDLAAALASVARTATPPRRRLVPLAVVLATTAAAGSFLAGGAREEGSPPRMVRAGESWVDRCEVTAAEYSEFVAATGRRPPPIWRNGRPTRGREKRPVTFVSREDAAAYAAWAGKRLPTVEEFRAASAGVERLGAEDIICAPAALDIGPGDADGGRDLSACGALHLAGNVAEWTSTESTSGPRLGVVFGGHWKAPWAQCVRKPEEEIPVDTREATVGFRCAKSAK
ncbi:MAG TPA: bifunctional serine/threonine-protein kinase/formylglycine-generating enzyme family protein [Planctomycetota bacterium]|nr:bifunctional serine/threonine-protein kinase/formylglycine-generating enzyme family protein [Planctomycetota bacterium]